MHSRIKLLLLLSALSGPVFGETLEEYVNTCKSELGFNSIPNYSCTADTVPTEEGRLGWKRLADKVDAVFLCRGIANDVVGLNGLIVTNRSSGKTCFFDAQQWQGIEIPSPTKSNASDFWLQPDELVEDDNRCANCHTNGPYIINEKVSSTMAHFGLINNGRDLDIRTNNYEAVGRAHADWNFEFVDTNLDFGCAGACHSVAGRSSDVDGSVAKTALDILAFPRENDWMFPRPKKNGDFFWVNRDTPNASGDYETLGSITSAYPEAVCGGNPRSATAKIVGETRTYSPRPVFEELKYFDLEQGLACVNDDQPDGRCHDYVVSYQCNGIWKSFDRDTPNGTGDYENRSKIPSGELCPNPTAIRAAAVGIPTQFYGPPDKIAYFSASRGLACLNNDQPDGKCNNYQIKFICD